MSDKTSYKVGRLIESYGIAEIESELIEKWKGSGTGRSSLRDLTDEFNRRLLRAAMQRAGMNLYRKEVGSTYRTLTDDTVNEADRTSVRRELLREGVPIDDVESDFVSYSAVYNYLTDYLDENYEPVSDDEQIRKDKDRIEKLRTRVKNVVSDTVKRSSNSGRLRIDDYRVFVDISVYCDNCGRKHDAADFFDKRECECEG